MRHDQPHSIIDHIAQIVKQVKQHGFDDPILFKAFSEQDAQSILLMVKDASSGNSPLRRLALEDALLEIFGCDFHITPEEQMLSFCKDKLNSSNSLCLTEVKTLTDNIYQTLRTILSPRLLDKLGFGIDAPPDKTNSQHLYDQKQSFFYSSLDQYYSPDQVYSSPEPKTTEHDTLYAWSLSH